MIQKWILFIVVSFFFGIIGWKTTYAQGKYTSFSGIYPHLANYNNEGECGTGAVVPWGGRLWVITYGPHLPFGSSDKLYEITPGLQKTVYPGSIGGTPANRMIHRESNQLFIGPYAISESGFVRVIPYDKMPGRITGNARHLTDPAGKVYFGTMEEGVYEVDVHTLQPLLLYKDGNVGENPGQGEGSVKQPMASLAGAHGKGFYSGQGVVVYSNNGETGQEALRRFDVESGSLSEWDGREWKLIRRNQFTEVTGPGGIYGNNAPETDPVWSTGWDHKSVLLGVRDLGKWSFYRLPIASHTYDGAHGWNTEWPRIRDIGTPGNPDYLMTMHGMFWKFPGTFNASNTAGIRPRSAYLKVIGDFTRWGNRLVFGCDDSANKEFLNKRKAKGNIEGPGQSNSNLWFTPPEMPDMLGPSTAGGAVWLSEDLPAGAVSEPFLFAGWDIRSVWIKNESPRPVLFTFEVDSDGTGRWKMMRKTRVNAGSAVALSFGPEENGEWVRVKVDSPARATVYFSYAQRETRNKECAPLFDGLSGVNSSESKGGLLWGLGNNRRKLGLLAGIVNRDGFKETGYYELDSTMNLVRKEDDKTASFIRDKFAVPKQAVIFDKASILVIDDRERRWRLPWGNRAYEGLTGNGLLRICREVATERDLFNCGGTFYELPAENADGFAKIRPIASHNFRIHDYASYRGLLIMSGIDPSEAGENEHIIASADGKAALWAGVIDDLWKMGKPSGEGGPWFDTPVNAGEASDPYLIGFYDRRNLQLNHSSGKTVRFIMEVEAAGHGPWMVYREVKVKPGQTFSFDFPENFQARWIRFIADRDCRATALLKYD